MSRNEEIGLSLIKGKKITRDDILYLQKYHQDNNERLSEEEILSTDYVKLPQRYKNVQTAMVRRGYIATGKRPEYLGDKARLEMYG